MMVLLKKLGFTYRLMRMPLKVRSTARKLCAGVRKKLKITMGPMLRRS